MNCAFCGSSSSMQVLTARDPDLISQDFFQLRMCSDCTLAFTHPRPGKQDLAKFYTRQYYGRLKLYPFNFLEKTISVFQSIRAGKIKKIIGKGRVLDIGCGNGMFLKGLLNEGYDLYGIEPSQPAKTYHADAGLKITYGELKDANYPGSFFDLITLWHVFEHVSEPVELLKEVRRVIKPGKTLIMAIPNFASLESRLAGRNWFHLDLPRHLYHYNPATLENILKIEGFKIFKIEYFSLEFGSFGLFQTLMNMLGGEFNFLAKILKGNNINKFQSNKRYYSLGIFLFLMPFLPLIILFSLVEACCKKGAILTVYAQAIK